MARYECGNCGRDDFDSFQELQDHDCDEWLDDDPDGGATPRLVADGGAQTHDSKYVNPTGPGYQGVYSTDGHTVEISVAAMTHIEWTTDTRVHGVDDTSEPGIQIVADRRSDLEIVGDCTVENRGHGTLVHCHPPVLRALDTHSAGDDIRVYRYEHGLTVVARDTDPFVGGGY